jgi:hypothetical protein
VANGSGAGKQTGTIASNWVENGERQAAKFAAGIPASRRSFYNRG